MDWETDSQNEKQTVRETDVKQEVMNAYDLRKKLTATTFIFLCITYASIPFESQIAFLLLEATHLHFQMVGVKHRPMI